MRALLILAVALPVAFTLSACGEQEQVVVYKQGKYQGKPDNRAWDNAPPAAEWRGGQWKQGDRTSWEESIKSRQLAQHEHKRIYQ
jgi:hypothetical protein